jgi:hypothetical protein
MFSIVLTFLISTYPWPLRPFGSAHQVSATLGDAREDVADPRFHRGIDIPASIGTKVYSITSDTAYTGGSGANRYVRVGDYWYIHIIPCVDSGVEVLGILDTINTPPDTIGKVLDYPPPPVPRVTTSIFSLVLLVVLSKIPFFIVVVQLAMMIH